MVSGSKATSKARGTRRSGALGFILGSTGTPGGRGARRSGPLWFTLGFTLEDRVTLDFWALALERGIMGSVKKNFFF